MRIANEPYSFLDDPAVPRFDAPDNFTVMDANCGLCARGAAWIARNDTEKKFRIRDANIFNRIVAQMKRWFKDVV